MHICRFHLFLEQDHDHEHCQELALWLKMVIWEGCHGLQRRTLEPQSTFTLSPTNGNDFPKDIQAFFSTLSDPGVISSEPEYIGLTEVSTVPLTLLNAIKLNDDANQLQSTQIET